MFSIKYLHLWTKTKVNEHCYYHSLYENFDKIVGEKTARKLPVLNDAKVLEVIYISPNYETFSFLVGYRIGAKILEGLFHLEYNEEELNHIRDFLTEEGFIEALIKWIDEGDLNTINFGGTSIWKS